MTLQEIISTALERIQHIAKTETVFGDPVIVGGVTIIPISKVSVGFAAGGAGKMDKGGSGAGTGGGVNVTPVALITISGDDIRVHTLRDGELDIEKLFSLAPEAVRKVADIFKKKDSGKDKDTDKSVSGNDKRAGNNEDKPADNDENAG
jgi:uncharacterized spore protein YtfJ